MCRGENVTGGGLSLNVGRGHLLKAFTAATHAALFRDVFFFLSSVVP